MSEPVDDDGVSAPGDAERYDTARRRARELCDELLSETAVEPPLDEISELLDIPPMPRAASPQLALAELREILSRVSGPASPVVTPVPIAVPLWSLAGAQDELITPGPEMVPEAHAAGPGALAERTAGERERAEAPTGGAETGDEEDPPPQGARPPAVPPPLPPMGGPLIDKQQGPRRAAVTPRVSVPRPPEADDRAAIEILAGEPPAIVIDAGEPPPPPVAEARPRVLPPPLPPTDDSPFALDEPGDLRQAAELALAIEGTEIGPRPELDPEAEAPTGPGQEGDEDIPFADTSATQIGSDLAPVFTRAESQTPSEISVRIEHTNADEDQTNLGVREPRNTGSRPRAATPKPADPRAMWASGDARPLPVFETEEESSSVTSVDPNEDVSLSMKPDEAVQFELLARKPSSASPTGGAARPLVPHRASLGAEELEPTDLARLGQVTGGIDDDVTPPPQDMPLPRNARASSEIEITVEEDGVESTAPPRPPPRKR